MKISVVQQRYGSDILGGAETHGALIARLLSPHHEVEVVTTTAGDYQTWSEAYDAGTEVHDGIPVHRFPVTKGRSAAWSTLSTVLHDGFRQEEFARLSSDARDAFIERIRRWPDALQEEFIRGQGPIAPGVVQYLRDTEPDETLFITYLYPTTYDGLLAVAPGRASIVPTLHDEPAAYLPAFGRRLSTARLLCSTETEIALAQRLYPETPLTAERLGYGIDLPEDQIREPGDPAFLLYAGRIDTSKGVDDLLRWYTELRMLLQDPPRLILIGEVLMDLPKIKGVEARGFVSEAEKIELMRTAIAFIHPSPFESLGIVILEALACRTPIIVTARSEVMKEHCRRSGAGVWISDGAELAATLRRFAVGTTRAELGARGRAWVETEYSMPSYEKRLLEAFPCSISHP